MEIHEYKISITEEELDAFGLALEEYLVRQIDSSPFSNTLEKFEDFHEEELSAMYSLNRLGYALTIKNESENFFDHERVNDVYKWLEQMWAVKGDNTPDESQSDSKGQ